jgi:hypothetical protein
MKNYCDENGICAARQTDWPDCRFFLKSETMGGICLWLSPGGRCIALPEQFEEKRRAKNETAIARAEG